MNIRLALATEFLPLQPERCRRLGLIVHGLVTNAARHACFEARTGEIKIKLSSNRRGGELRHPGQWIAAVAERCGARTADQQ